jgi:hypothetical protein
VRSNLRQSLACFVMVISVSALPGCARAVDGTPVGPHNVGLPPSSSKTKSSPAQPVKDFDISRLSQLQGEFPPGFEHVRAMPVTTLGANADKFSTIGVGDIVAIDPTACRSLLQPVRAPRDAQFTMVAGIGKGVIMVGAVNSPDPLPKNAVPGGCDHVAVTQRIPGRQFDSTVTHLPGPAIEGVVTMESMAVAVQGIIPGNPHAEAALRGLLIKAVDAVRAA